VKKVHGIGLLIVGGQELCCETRVINSRSENSCPLGKEYETDGQKAIDRLFDYTYETIC
jgi:hypothetical protein